MSRDVSLGAVYNQTGAGLTAAYNFGAVFMPSRGQVLNLFPQATGDPGVPGVTSTTVKLQGRYSSTSPWDDVQTKNINTGASAVEQTFGTFPGAGATLGYGPLMFDPRGYPGGMRVGVKVVGVPAAADNVLVNAAVSL